MYICLENKNVVMEDRITDYNWPIWIACDLRQRQHLQQCLQIPRLRTKFESVNWYSDGHSWYDCA
jgi:hypothetical protein